MRKTTVYFPDDLARALARAARQTGRSEAELIRDGVRRAIMETEPPAPTMPLFASRDPTLADRVDELLQGLGDA